MEFNGMVTKKQLLAKIETLETRVKKAEKRCEKAEKTCEELNETINKLLKKSDKPTEKSKIQMWLEDDRVNDLQNYLNKVTK
jgi:uncharacterized coiled-coil protein SlyX